MIVEKADNFLKKYSLHSSKSRLMVAFSGGADSLCLLHSFNVLSKEYGFWILAAHLNHNWRGEESINEAIKAEDFAKKMEYRFVLKKLDEKLPHTELEARNQRYDFFNRASNLYNIDAIFTAHTSSDQVETVLYRIIKGTGTLGLKGIPEKRDQKGLPSIYRPLLSVSRNEIMEYCEKNELHPVFDSSNSDTKYLRNSIRLDLLPELRKYNSELDSAILRLSEISAESEEILGIYLSEIKQKVFEDESIVISKFIVLPLAVQKRLVIELLNNEKIICDYKKVTEVLEFINGNCSLKSGNTLSIGKDRWLFVSDKIIKIITSIKSDVIKSFIKVNLEGEFFHEELNKTLKISKWQGGAHIEFPIDSGSLIYADLSQLSEPMTFRTRLDGDRIQPFGMSQTTKLKKYLINRGVPEHKRDSLPMLAINDEIIWVVGIGTSEKFRVNGIPTHVIAVY